MNKELLCASLVGVLSMVTTSITQAGHSDGDTRAYSGVAACGGNHLNRVGGNERQQSQYILRNYNEKGAININRMRVYNATGSLVFDSDISGFPLFSNGILDASDQSLDPHQSARLSSQELFGDSSPPNTERPIQMIFEWSADSKVLIPEIAIVRQARERKVDEFGNVKIRFENSRHLYECRHIKLEKEKGHRKNRHDD